jgi:ABC-type antimicrobial peptide transport system permease subunit
MAAVGLYGVFAYSVASRTREIGIRMALGARASGVLRMVLRQAAGLAVAGIVIGTACGVALGRILESKLFGVEPLDPLTFTGAALVLGLVTMAAAAMPTRAALRVDPATALRQE